MHEPLGLLRATFVLEQHLGHVTFAANLRAVVEQDEGIDASWVPVHYAPSAAWWERIPGLPEGARGLLRGRSEVRRGTRRRESSITFFNTQVPAVIGGRGARRGAYVLCTDITPAQYDRMADAYQHRADGSGPVARLKATINRRVMHGAVAHVAWSVWVRDSLVQEYGVPHDSVHVIPPGVDLSRWAVARTHDRSGPVRILFVGGDFDRKGGPRLIDAFRSLPSGAAELDVVTKSPLTAGPGIRVHRDFAPNDPGLVELYHRSDVFALPSEAEAFGIAAAEAAAAGLPVVAARVGGLPDIVADGESGFLVPPGDTAALTARLAALVDDAELRRRMSVSATARAAERFDGAHNARRIVELLRGSVAS